MMQRSLNWLLIDDSGEHVLLEKKLKYLEKAINPPLYALRMNGYDILHRSSEERNKDTRKVQDILNT